MLKSVNITLKTLYSVQALNLFADNLLIPVFAFLVLQVGGNVQIAGYLWGTQFAVSALVGIIVASITDLPGLQKKWLSIVYAMKFLVWISLVFIQTIPMLFIAQIITGLAGAIGGPAFNSLISDHLDESAHIREWSLLQVTSNVSVAIAGILSGLLLVSIGFSGLFAIMALLELGSFILIISFLSLKSNK